MNLRAITAMLGSPEVSRWMESIESRLNSLAAQIVAAFTLKQTYSFVLGTTYTVAAPGGGNVFSGSVTTVAGDILVIQAQITGVSDAVAPGTDILAEVRVDNLPVNAASLTVHSAIGEPVSLSLSARVAGLVAGAHNVQIHLLPAAGNFASVASSGDAVITVLRTTV